MPDNLTFVTERSVMKWNSASLGARHVDEISIILYVMRNREITILRRPIRSSGRRFGGRVTGPTGPH